MLKFTHNAFDTRCQMKCSMWPSVVRFAPSPLRFGGGGVKHSVLEATRTTLFLSPIA